LEEAFSAVWRYKRLRLAGIPAAAAARTAVAVVAAHTVVVAAVAAAPAGTAAAAQAARIVAEEAAHTAAEAVAPAGTAAVTAVHTAPEAVHIVVREAIELPAYHSFYKIVRHHRVASRMLHKISYLYFLS